MDPLQEAADLGRGRGSCRCDRIEYDDEQLNFLRAIDQYKQQYNRPHPTWAEVLAVVKNLGYKKDAT